MDMNSNFHLTLTPPYLQVDVVHVDGVRQHHTDGGDPHAQDGDEGRQAGLVRIHNAAVAVHTHHHQRDHRGVDGSVLDTHTDGRKLTRGGR